MITLLLVSHCLLLFFSLFSSPCEMFNSSSVPIVSLSFAPVSMWRNNSDNSFCVLFYTSHAGSIHLTSHHLAVECGSTVGRRDWLRSNTCAIFCCENHSGSQSNHTLSHGQKNVSRRIVTAVQKKGSHSNSARWLTAPSHHTR